MKTVEDFGAQGEWPSHPELLDWLATEFVRSGWDVKAMQRLIVTSATYRQSSQVTPDLLQRDPENRLLARGPRMRLPAEMVRDQALAISGLLVDKIGGPSVKPYQPAGLWKELNNGDEYTAGSRRGSLPPQPVHFLEAHDAAALDDDLRCRRDARPVCAPLPDQHADAGSRADERGDLSSKRRASSPSG